MKIRYHEFGFYIQCLNKNFKTEAWVKFCFNRSCEECTFNKLKNMKNKSLKKMNKTTFDFTNGKFLILFFESKR